MATKSTSEETSFRELLEIPTNELSARDRLLQAAVTLFNRDGIQCTGIDKIIAQAEVAKMTFYKHFPSKTDLIVAYLNYEENKWESIKRRHLSDDAAIPEKKILGLFDALSSFFSRKDYNGSPFIKAQSDIGLAEENEARKLIGQHFDKTRQFIRGELTKAGKGKLDAQLIPIMSLFVGALVMSRFEKDKEVAQQNKKAVELLLMS